MSGPIPNRILDHFEQAKAFLTDCYKGRPVLEGFLKALSTQIQEAEDMLWDVIQSRLLGTTTATIPSETDDGSDDVVLDGGEAVIVNMDATGAQLDPIGDLVGEARDGRDDTDYTAAIKMRIRANASDGHPEDLIAIAQLGAGPTATVDYRENAEPGRTGFEVEVLGTMSGPTIAKFLNLARPAGVLGTFRWTTAENEVQVARWGWSGDAAIGVGLDWSGNSGDPYSVPVYVKELES